MAGWRAPGRGVEGRYLAEQGRSERLNAQGRHSEAADRLVPASAVYLPQILPFRTRGCGPAGVPAPGDLTASARWHLTASQHRTPSLTS